MPLIVGTGATRTEDFAEYARHAREIGADAILVTSPPYALPTEKENALHALTIDRAANLPIMLYNYPGRMGVDIHERAPVTRLEREGGDWTATAGKHRVTARKVIRLERARLLLAECALPLVHVATAIGFINVPILEVSDGDWQKGMDLYFLSAVRAIRLVTPVMQRQKSGVIINISTAWRSSLRLVFPTSVFFAPALHPSSRSSRTPMRGTTFGPTIPARLD